MLFDRKNMEATSKEKSRQERVGAPRDPAAMGTGTVPFTDPELRFQIFSTPYYTTSYGRKSCTTTSMVFDSMIHDEFVWLESKYQKKGVRIHSL